MPVSVLFITKLSSRLLCVCMHALDMAACVGRCGESSHGRSV